MTTIIDSMVVEIGLDTSKFTKQQREANAEWLKVNQEALKFGKGIESQADRVNDAFSTIKTQALELFAVLGGGAALINFTTKMTTADAAVGRLSRNINIPPSTISAWQGMARLFGSTAEGMAGSFTQISDAVEGFKIGKISPLIADFRALSTAGGTIIDVNKGIDQTLIDISANLAKVHATDPARAGLLGRMIGLDPGLYDALINGPDFTKQMLDRVKALGVATKESTDQAGKLAQAWNAVILAIEGKGRTVLTGGGDLSLSGAAASMLNVITKDLSTKREWFGGLKNTTGAEWWEAIKQGATWTHATDSSSSSSIGTPAGGGSFGSASEKEAFIREESVRRGLNPDVMVKVAKSEGFDKFLGDNGTSGGAFQLHVTPGGRGRAVGDQFRAKTGLDPLDPANERAGIQFALDDIKQNGLAAYHGAARVNLANNAGGAGGGTTISVTGPVNVYPPPGVDGKQMAGQFVSTLKGQSFAAQANNGQN